MTIIGITCQQVSLSNIIKMGFKHLLFTDFKGFYLCIYCNVVYYVTQKTSPCLGNFCANRISVVTAKFI
jgi:hypothetical protein